MNQRPDDRLDLLWELLVFLARHVYHHCAAHEPLRVSLEVDCENYTPILRARSPEVVCVRWGFLVEYCGLAVIGGEVGCELRLCL